MRSANKSKFYSLRCIHAPLQRQCTYFFPEVFPKGSVPQPNTAKTNLVYAGWNVHIERLFFANGQRMSPSYGPSGQYADCMYNSGDPWRDATVSADGTAFPSTPQQPIAVGDGFHCSDMSTLDGTIDPTIKAVQTKALQSIHGWLQGFKPSKRKVQRRVSRVEYERMWRM